jgi:hypothetical protein
MSSDPFERDLIAAFRAEAYSVPLRLQAAELHRRLAPRTRLLPARVLWRLAGMAVIAIALSVLLVTAPGRLGIPGPAATAECQVSAVTRHGSWWEEIGGENAFFNADPGQFHAGADWLIHVRFFPAPEEGQQASMWAQRVGDEERVAALLDEPADPENIYRFDEPVPVLPGALYLFQQPLPAAGCWQLVAAIDAQVVGTATIEVNPAPPDADRTPDPIAPTPRLPEPSRTPLPAETPAPSATDLGDEVGRDGDSVTAAGKIVQLPGDTPRLCFYLGVTTASMSQPVDAGCHPLRVPVDGVDLERLPGWTERGGGGMSGYLEAKGTWAEGTLVVRDVFAAIAPRPFVIPPAPCEAPPGGWPGRPSAEDAVEAEASSLRLTDEVDDNPALYSGIWVADLEGAAPIVVGTVGKVEEVRERLAEIYPYNMCVVKVDYSAAQLQPVADRLAQSDGRWWTDVDPATARVLVDLPVLDEEAVSRIGADADKVTVRPLVARAPDSD